MTRLWKILVPFSVLCSGCAVGPKYQKPVAQAPEQFRELKGNSDWKMAAPSDALLKGKWWEVFGDPQLNRLEELVDVNNQNIKQAEAQFREARAIVAPTTRITIPPSAQRLHHPNLRGQQLGPGNRDPSTSYSVPVAASWEPDLWGRVRLSVQNAVANAQVSGPILKISGSASRRCWPPNISTGGAGHAVEGAGRYHRKPIEKNLQLTIDRHTGGVASNRDITLAQTQIAGALAQSPICASRGLRPSTPSRC